MMTDPIADMLTRIRNAAHARQTKVDIPHSKLKTQIARILEDEGYIQGSEVVEAQPQDVLRVSLKYTPDEKSVIQSLERISKPGRRVYVNRKRLPRVLSGLGIAIVSTSRGVMTDREARRAGVGGEVLCYIT